MLCYCAGACPDGAVNNTCVAADNAWCFAAVREEYDEKTGLLAPERTYGCLQPEESGYMQCQGRFSPFEVPTTIQCCRDRDRCNRDLTPMYEPTPEDDYTSEYLGRDDTIHQMALLISVALCLVVFVVAIVLVYMRYRKRLERRDSQDEAQSSYDLLITGPGLITGLAETSSGSGSGKPYLAQRTVAREVSLMEKIGQGRYGQVYRGLYQGQSVAVKVFFTMEEASWQREKEVYESCRLQHPNVLGFIAADITSSVYGRGCTEMWLITEYHSYGSLHDYLKLHVLDVTDMLHMALSIVQGLDYLHKEVVATTVRPAVAHRDIKSKNILVKKDGECCLADFGLAVMYAYAGEKRELNVPCTRQGTRRYMPPEVLDETQRTTSFEAFKQADMYSFSLVLWELCLRCATGDKLQNYEDYQVPYEGLVPPDPTFDDMYDLVCVENIRPPIPARWLHHKPLLTMKRLMEDCWRRNPGARLRILSVKKHMLSLITSLQRTETAPVHV